MQFFSSSRLTFDRLHSDLDFHQSCRLSLPLINWRQCCRYLSHRSTTTRHALHRLHPPRSATRSTKRSTCCFWCDRNDSGDLSGVRASSGISGTAWVHPGYCNGATHKRSLQESSSERQNNIQFRANTDGCQGLDGYIARWRQDPNIFSLSVTRVMLWCWLLFHMLTTWDVDGASDWNTPLHSPSNPDFDACESTTNHHVPSLNV